MKEEVIIKMDLEHLDEILRDILDQFKLLNLSIEKIFWEIEKTNSYYAYLWKNYRSKKQKVRGKHERTMPQMWKHNANKI